MSRQLIAIATCRVSSIEQLESNSLNRQEASVKEAAEYLKARIPNDGIWSGSVSSKSGSNYSRRDLREMIEYCKKHPSVKYLIVDEIDRFMRSVDEMFYFEVLFREQVGVKVWYAGDPALNSDDPSTKLMRALEAFKAEGSNLERQIKSIKGQTDALKQGRYPFSPKPGYRRGYERAVQEVDPLRGPALKLVLEKIANKLITPSQGLVELNKSDFVKGHSLYKMDKFRKILIDPYYAGIVEVDKQVKVRNENGLHEPLITKERHYELIRIMNSKLKNQSGPRKNGNPLYPLSNLVNCASCADSPIGRLAGLTLTNGKNKANTYEKYRCRSCKRYLNKDELHNEIRQQFINHPVTKRGLDDLIKALNIVWKQKEGQAIQDAVRLRHKIDTIQTSIDNSVEAATEPSNITIKKEILASIARKKEEIILIEEQHHEINEAAENDKEQFIRFAFKFIEDMGNNFLDTSIVSPENRKRCKQVVFPAGFYVDSHKKVYTPEISKLYRFAAMKMDTEVSDNSLVVRVRRL